MIFLQLHKNYIILYFWHPLYRVPDIKRCTSRLLIRDVQKRGPGSWKLFSYVWKSFYTWHIKLRGFRIVNGKIFSAHIFMYFVERKRQEEDGDCGENYRENKWARFIRQTHCSMWKSHCFWWRGAIKEITAGQSFWDVFVSFFFVHFALIFWTF